MKGHSFLFRQQQQKITSVDLTVRNVDNPQGYSVFQVMRMIEGSSGGFKFSILGFFLVGVGNLASNFWQA